MLQQEYFYYSDYNLSYDQAIFGCQMTMFDNILRVYCSRLKSIIKYSYLIYARESN